MSLLHALLLGLLQGISEFLPISSSGHLVLAQSLIPGFAQPGVLFDVMVHVGTMGAIVGYYYADILDLARSLWTFDEAARQQRRLLGLLLLGNVPTAVIGLGLEPHISWLFHNTLLVGFMLLVTGTLLWLAENFRRPQGRHLQQLTSFDALLAGLFQGLAILPGISRSGATLAALLFRGVDGAGAARYAFMLALPAVAGAAMLSLPDAQHLATGELSVYLAAAGIAFISGMASIHLLLKVLRQGRLHIFALYCWLAGSATIAFVHL